MSSKKPPYLMTREEWKKERNECRSNWVQQNYTKASKSQAIGRSNRLEFLLFGIDQFIYDKALQGKEWAVEAREYGVYDRHEVILEKAREEGLIPALARFTLSLDDNYPYSVNDTEDRNFNSIGEALSAELPNEHAAYILTEYAELDDECVYRSRQIVGMSRLSLLTKEDKSLG